MFNDIVPQLYQSKIYLAYLSVFQSYQKVFKKFLRRNDGILEILNNFTIQLKSFQISVSAINLHVNTGSRPRKYLIIQVPIDFEINAV